MGWGRARWRRQAWRIPPLRFSWLALAAFVPQLIAVYLPATRPRISDAWGAAGLLVSLGLYLLFCWLNRRIPGIALLAAGLISNLLVMAANGGFMPISPETASRLVPENILASLEPGSRFGWKDILLLPEATRLFFLSDCLLLPQGFPYQVAFSPGDILIAGGAFWLMAAGAERPVLKERS